MSNVAKAISKRTIVIYHNASKPVKKLAASNGRFKPGHFDKQICAHPYRAPSHSKAGLGAFLFSASMSARRSFTAHGMSLYRRKTKYRRKT
jgi:hypothetical protein